MPQNPKPPTWEEVVARCLAAGDSPDQIVRTLDAIQKVQDIYQAPRNKNKSVLSDRLPLVKS